MASSALHPTDDVEEAVNAVLNKTLPISIAAKLYRIPNRTLRDHLEKYRLNPLCLSITVEDIRREKAELERQDAINNNTDTPYFVYRSWYCHACHVDRMEDMRQCSKCNKWYHEVCVGLTVNDVDYFECPGGC